MKKLMATLTALLTLTITANAMSYSQAREQALFLTDKMAYELNLTQEQYDAAYEVNLDYLMSINTHDDLYGTYWNNRNIDLSYILLDWQYRAFCEASYFYRPLYWTSGAWHFAIYARYPRRGFLYFGRPSIFISYRGGHGWSHNGGRSWYKDRTFNHGAIGHGHGMRDRFDKGDFNKGNRPSGGNRPNFNRGEGNGNKPGGNRNNGNGSFNGRRNPGGNGGANDSNRRPGSNGPTTRPTRESSTRVTARPNVQDNSSKASTSGSVGVGTTTKAPSNTFTPRSNGNVRSQSVSPSRSSSVSRSTTGGGTSGKASGGGSGRGGHFGGRR